MEINKIYNMDFLQGVQEIEDESIDFIFTDIPYNISRANGLKGYLGCKHGIDFGDWDKGFNEESLKILVPKIKKGGGIFIFHAFEQYDVVRNTFLQEGLELKDRVIWQKTNPMPRNRDRRWISDIELATWYVKPGAKWIFNRQDEKFESSVLRYPNESGPNRMHPTQKNLEMIKYILKIHTNEGNLVLDPFAGSGTTLVACAQLNRNFIGFEINPEYYEIALKRLEGGVK